MQPQEATKEPMIELDTGGTVSYTHLRAHET